QVQGHGGGALQIGGSGHGDHGQGHGSGLAPGHGVLGQGRHGDGEAVLVHGGGAGGAVRPGNADYTGAVGVLGGLDLIALRIGGGGNDSAVPLGLHYLLGAVGVPGGL